MVHTASGWRNDNLEGAAPERDDRARANAVLVRPPACRGCSQAVEPALHHLQQCGCRQQKLSLRVHAQAEDRGRDRPVG